MSGAARRRTRPAGLAAIATLAGWAALTWTARAQAYRDLTTFAQPAIEGGGQGMLFTGSPRFKQYDCTMCHQYPAETVRFVITSDPPELFSTQQWQPGQQYTIVVQLVAEIWRYQDNVNTFLLEFDDDAGRPVGRFVDGELQEPHGPGGGYALNGVVAGRTSPAGLTRWVFTYEAPAAGTGRITLYSAGVDGNGAGAAGDADPSLDADPQGDDVFVQQIRFCEQGSACDAEVPEGHGNEAAIHEPASPAGLDCALRRTPAPAGDQALWWGSILSALLLLRRRSGGPCGSTAPR